MISLELHKAYDALERDRLLDLLEGYGVGLRDFQILHIYWEILMMVACASGYYGEALK